MLPTIHNRAQLVGAGELGLAYRTVYRIELVGCVIGASSIGMTQSFDVQSYPLGFTTGLSLETGRTGGPTQTR